MSQIKIHLVLLQIALVYETKNRTYKTTFNFALIRNHNGNYGGCHLKETMGHTVLF